MRSYEQYNDEDEDKDRYGDEDEDDAEVAAASNVRLAPLLSSHFALCCSSL